MHSLQVENGLSVAHNEEKVKDVSLCFLCSYVKSGRVYANTREKNNQLVHLSTCLLVNLSTYHTLSTFPQEI